MFVAAGISDVQAGSSNPARDRKGQEPLAQRRCSLWSLASGKIDKLQQKTLGFNFK